ncbi:MAG: hypothetical protein JXA54_03265 [Candidatus Heimdallarchaeota archaeon]|nr:hypothetical protein [Candidatus Heimdallarchaeota archaeon]
MNAINYEPFRQQTKSIDIVTVGCENHLQKRNTLKGLALQKLVSYVMGNSNENKSIMRIFEELTENEIEYFTVLKPFKTLEKKFFYKWIYIHQSDFTDYVEIWVRKQSIEKNWKRCNFCGQIIKSKEQFSKKCWKCKKGYFQIQVKKETEWVLLNKGSKQRMIEFLLTAGYLKSVQIRKHLDFFSFSNNIFSIFEAKNKEKTGLTIMDLRKTLIYPFILSRCGYVVKKLLIIYNGEITAKLQRELSQGFGSSFPFDIELCHVIHFLNRYAISVKEVKVKQENNKYFYEIIPGQTNTILINLSSITSTR